MRRFIPHKSEEARHLLGCFKRLQELRLVIHARRYGVPQIQSQVMRHGKLWDAGEYLHPADFGALFTLWSSSQREWAEKWLHMLRY